MSDSERQEATKWVAWSIPVILLFGIIGTTCAFATDACGQMGGTILERKVMENSFQNSEARKTEIMTWEAQKAQLEVQLTDPTLSESRKAAIRGQLAAIDIQLKVAREKSDQILLKQ